MQSTPYEAKRYAQRHALDDKRGTRGVVPPGVGAGASSLLDEDEDAVAVPGFKAPSYQTADGSLVMNSRCAMCGVGMAPSDLLQDPTGTKCGSCSKSMATKHGAKGPVETLTGPKKVQQVATAEAEVAPQRVEASKTHPPNPLKVKSPKGSAPAPSGGDGPSGVFADTDPDSDFTTEVNFSSCEAVAFCGGKGGHPGPCAGDADANTPPPDHVRIQQSNITSQDPSKSLTVKEGLPGRNAYAGAQHTYEKNATGNWVHQASGKVADSAVQNRLDIAAYKLKK